MLKTENYLHCLRSLELLSLKTNFKWLRSGDLECKGLNNNNHHHNNSCCSNLYYNVHQRNKKKLNTL